MTTATFPRIIALAGSLVLIGQMTASADEQVKVTADNFVRAESDSYIAVAAKQAGSVGRFFHYREAMPIDKQTVVRANRDTLYSAAIFDLDAGPATVTLPEAEGRFMSLQVINQDHYVVGSVHYGAGSYKIEREQAGTRYVLAAVRTLVNPEDPADVKKVHELQGAIEIEQPGGSGKLDLPQWDTQSQKEVHNALLILASSLPDTKRMFGDKEHVDPIRHLIGTASAWGGNPETDALYLNVTPPKNDGKTVYALTVPATVPVNGFWSISRYGKDGYFHKNKLDAYTFNNMTAKKEADGSTMIRFGGCNAEISNCLPIEKGWNYMVRLYRPDTSVLDGSWTFPVAKPRD